jgi:DNA helicase-2/ATP-dependent DNA helicase PcrA
MARISCAHCGDVHGSVAEVRACAVTHPAPRQPAVSADEPAAWLEDLSWLDDPGLGAAGRSTVPAGPPSTRPRRNLPPVVTGLDRTLSADAASLAGPDRLGRSVLVAPGQAVPAPWSGAAVVAVPSGSQRDHELLARLHRAWLGRERLVLVLEGELPDPRPVLRVPFWELGPGTELPGERLRFLLTANTVDARDPVGPRFEPVARAYALGAVPGGPADVLLPDGTAAWADGGPLEPVAAAELAGHPSIPRVHLVAGRLTPVGGPVQPGAELAPDQLAAVAHARGPARIIAPAGSGKTRVLTERTRHLVRDRGLAPAAVSLVAYNRRAREEMAERLADVAGLDIRTLNSLALAIVNGTGPFRAAAGTRTRRTVDERDARRRLEEIVPTGRRRANTDPLEEWIDALAASRLGLRSPADIEEDYAGVTDFEGVLRQYRSQLARADELDFDEQIVAALEILLTDPDALAAARAACPVLLVDEFQDLTPAHLLLVRLLAGPAGEVFAVGDDDQTIYGYTGASPAWLIEFDRWFPGAADHPLTVNYRCPPEVVTAAGNLLSYNRRRVPKEIHAAPGRSAEGRGLVVLRAEQPQEALVEHVRGLLTDGVDPSEIAVLARVNAALLPPLVFLADAGIPVRRPPGVDPRLLERSGTSAALAWLRLAVAPERRLGKRDLAAALRRPPRGLSPKVAEWAADQGSVKELLGLAGRLSQPRDAGKVTEFVSDLTRLRKAAEAGADAARLLEIVYDGIGLLGAATQLDSAQRAPRRAAHADELLALRAVARLHPDPHDLEAWVRSRLESADHLTEGEPAVTLATIHATKGLEWPHVVVHDVRADLHPHQLAADTEEERRIFHVGVTRGRTSVLVLVSDPPSPFVPELSDPRPADLPWTPAPPPRPAPRPATGPGPALVPTGPARPGDPALRETLKRWRSARANVDGVPAYVVFSDATLDAIVAARPASLAGLGRIKGIGPTKLDRYGDELLGLLAEAADAE